MIFVTGDTHMPQDVSKLNSDNFPIGKTLSKDDYVIICGDYGGVWNMDHKDLYWLNWLQEKGWTTLFVDGNHENFDLLDAYPVKIWNGGKVHFINPSVIHLMRGQVYEIYGQKFFTMGGAASTDKEWRLEKGHPWWAREQPNNNEYKEAVENLEKHDFRVDYVITHTAPLDIKVLLGFRDYVCQIERFFLMIKREHDLQYKQWYFGHLHTDRQVDAQHTVIYEKVMRIL